MYGTIARLQVLPGRMSDFLQLNRDFADEIAGSASNTPTLSTGTPTSCTW